MQTILTKNDIDTKRDVLAELEYDPSIDVTDIGVLVKEGVVTLTGCASNFSEKWAALEAVKRVGGVNGIADEIEVKLVASPILTDGDIAVAATHLLNWCASVPTGATRVTVNNGFLTLEGEVELQYQKNAAETAVQRMRGLKGITNQMTVRPRLQALDINASIQRALERSALLDAKTISVETFGSVVLLQGKVRNHAEKDEAERVASAAAGVSSVENRLKVE